MKYLKFFLPAVAAIFLFSCSNTHMVSSYKDKNAVAKNYKKILVLGIFQQKDRAFRQATENELASRLRSMGYNAVTAMDEYGPKAFDKVPEDQIVSQLQSSGYDAVITTALLDKQKGKYYQPGNANYQPVGVRYNRFGGYYSTVYDRVYSPGYYSRTTNYVLETNLYRVPDGTLVYSGQTKSYDPSSTSALAQDNSKKIVKDMKKKGVFRK